jgi:hypothetical protein
MMVPPLWLDALATALSAALYPPEVSQELGLLPLQAARARSTVAPAAVNGVALLRFIEPPGARLKGPVAAAIVEVDVGGAA